MTAKAAPSPTDVKAGRCSRFHRRSLASSLSLQAPAYNIPACQAVRPTAAVGAWPLVLQYAVSLRAAALGAFQQAGRCTTLSGSAFIDQYSTAAAWHAALRGPFMEATCEHTLWSPIQNMYQPLEQLNQQGS